MPISFIKKTNRQTVQFVFPHCEKAHTWKIIDYAQKVLFFIGHRTLKMVRQLVNYRENLVDLIEKFSF